VDTPPFDEEAPRVAELLGTGAPLVQDDAHLSCPALMGAA
jgi:hypothetical protein